MRNKILLAMVLITGCFSSKEGSDSENRRDMKPSIFKSAYEGNTKEVEDYLNNGVNVNSISEHKATVLTIAASNGYLDMVNLLIDRGANVNFKSLYKDELGTIHQDIGNTALNKAAQYNNSQLSDIEKGKYSQIIKRLVKEGADVNIKDSTYFYSPLAWAVVNKDAEMINYFLDNNANIESKNDNEESPLMIAIKKGYLDIVELLLTKGAEIDAKNIRERTPLHWAAITKRIDIAKLLISKGADINATNENEITPLMSAMYGSYSKRERIRNASEKDKNLHKFFGGGTFTKQDEKNEESYHEIIKLLIERGADVNLHDNARLTPLMLASRNNSEEIVKILLAKNANKDAENSEQKTALDMAKENDAEEVIKILEETK